MDNVRVGCLLHILIETPAAINFFLFPSKQLSAYTPQAHAVIKQYALLLFSSILIAAIFAGRSDDQLGGQVAGALAVYHVGPIVRSASRLWQYMDPGDNTNWHLGSLAEPALYLVVHVVTGHLLARACWTAYLFPTTLDP